MTKVSSDREETKEQRGGLTSFYKKFNKISAAVLGTAGIVMDSGVLLGLAAIDVGQAYAVGRFEKWRDRRKAGKSLGRTALAGVKA